MLTGMSSIEWTTKISERKAPRRGKKSDAVSASFGGGGGGILETLPLPIDWNGSRSEEEKKGIKVYDLMAVTTAAGDKTRRECDDIFI